MAAFRIDSLDLKAVVAMFRDPNGDPRHIFVASELSFDDFRARFGNDYAHEHAQCKPLNFDNFGDNFYFGAVAIGNAGGPMAIIRANDAGEAEDILSEDFKCCQLSAEEIAELEADGHGETVRYNDGGTAYSSDYMTIRPVQLIRIDME